MFPIPIAAHGIPKIYSRKIAQPLKRSFLQFNKIRKKSLCRRPDILLRSVIVYDKVEF